MSKLFSFIISLLIIKTIISSTNGTKRKLKLSKYQKLIKWGLNNSLNLSKDLKFSKKNKFVAEKFITIDDIVMDIPPNVMLNVNKALEMLNYSKLKKEYQIYIKEDLESQKKKEAMEDPAHVDQSFLSYILYLCEHKKKKFEKTEFYKFTKIFFICSKII